MEDGNRKSLEMIFEGVKLPLVSMFLDIPNPLVFQFKNLMIRSANIIHLTD